MQCSPLQRINILNFYTILLGCYASNNSNNVIFSGHAIKDLTFIYGYWPFTFISARDLPGMSQANNHGWWLIPRQHRPVKSHYCTIILFLYSQ